MTNLNLTVFAFEGNTVRFVGTAQKPEWVAQDVCSVLGIKNARDTLADFEPDEKGVAIVYTPGGNQEMLTVTEPGLYRLIFKSRKEVAKRFQRWVFHEVLPSIRKTGSYALPHPDTEQLKLQLALVQAQERLMAASQVLGSINPDLPVLILRPDVTVIERTVPVETTVMVDQRNKPIAQYDGVGISYLAQRYGFGKGQRAINSCREWLLSIGVSENQWVEEPTAHITRKLPRQIVSWLDKQFATKRGYRQRLLGE